MPAPTSPPTSTRLPPSTFDILPPLHILLSRLLTTPPPPTTTSPSSLNTLPATNDTTSAPLNPKDLPPLSSALTAKIQKAKTLVQGLPGVEFTIEEQEEMIRWLEGEVRRGQEVLQGLRAGARGIVEGEG